MNDNLFKAIANPLRRQMIDTLAQTEWQSISVLSSKFDLTRQAMTKHLRVLEEGGVVYYKEVGREKLYNIDFAALKDCYDWVSEYRRFWDSTLDSLEKHLQNK